MSIVNENTYLLPITNNNNTIEIESNHHNYSNRIYCYFFIIIITFLLITTKYKHYFLIDNKIGENHIKSCNEMYGFNDLHCIQNSSISTSLTNNTYRIMLYGDSLIQKPNLMYNLSSNILNQLNVIYPKLKFDIIVSANNGNKINDLKTQLYKDCLSYQPHSVIMYWDSDVSIEDIDYINSNITIQNYIKDLNDVLYISNKLITNIAIAGPSLLGEKSSGKNKYDMYIDKYRDINRNTAYKYNITYVDIRNEYFNLIDRYINQSTLSSSLYYRLNYKKGSRGYYNNLTIDGEHPSMYGSFIEEQLFINQIITWYKNI